MAILDRGDQTVTIFPSVEGVDGYGNAERRPAAAGVEVSGVFVTQLAASEDASAGQSAAERYRLLGRMPVIAGFDAFAEIEWSGRRFEVVGTPVRRTFPARLAHVVAILQER